MKSMPPNVQITAPAAGRKAANRARYQRRYARHKPDPVRKEYPAGHMKLTARDRALIVIHGVPQYLQTIVRMRFGNKGSWGHGRQSHGTKSGPGRRPLPRLYRIKEGSPLLKRDHPTGTKLVRRFIRQSGGEATFWRNAYAALTGKQYG